MASTCHCIYEYQNTLQNLKMPSRINYTFQNTHYTFQNTHYTFQYTHYTFQNTHYTFQNTHYTFQNTHYTFGPGTCAMKGGYQVFNFNFQVYRNTGHNHVLFFVWLNGRMVENPEAQAAANDEEEREAIESYFLTGYKYKTILCFLWKYHGINHSMSTLKRCLREYGLKGKNAVDVDGNYITEAIQQNYKVQVLYQGIKVCGIPLDSNTECVFQETRCRGF